ncbi:MAG: FAD-dependent oxidoreductase [Clostridia bacterium]
MDIDMRVNKNENNQIVNLPARKLSVTGEWDLVIAGAGISGVAAAIAAARNDLRVCIIDKQYSPGGLATLGNVTMWLPLCNGNGRQVTSGLAEELLKLSVNDISKNLSATLSVDDLKKAGITDIPKCWKPGGDSKERTSKRYQVDFNPSEYLFSLEKLLIDSGVNILYDTRVCGVIKNDTECNLIDYLIVENKSGQSVIAGKAFIDATGDADIAYYSGENTISSDANVPAAWSYTWGKDGLKRRLITGGYSPKASREGYKGPFFRGDDATDVTSQVIASRQLVSVMLEDFRKKENDSSMQLIMPPVIPCFRMTRRLDGRFVLKNEHMHQWLDDTIGIVGDWRKAGPVYPVSFGSLCGKKTDNLLIVGRCISADNSVWDVHRVYPSCAVTGEAAGTAASIALVNNQRDLVDVSIITLQKKLISQGVLLNPRLLEK